MDHIGGKTPQPTFINFEAHKLHKEFDVAGTIKEGQPVKINAAGAIVALGAADEAYLCIGNSIHSRVAGQTATVIMKGHAVITAEAGAIQDAGPVKWSAYNAPTGRNRYVAAATSVLTQGIALDPAAAIGDEIEVLLTN